MKDLKDLVKRLQDDLDCANDKLDSANDKLQCVTEENKRLKTELGAARTVIAAHTKGHQLSVTAAPTPDACFSDVLMVPITMQVAAVAKAQETQEHILERMDVDTGSETDMCEIPATYYKTKWYFPNREPLDDIGWIFPGAILKVFPGLKNLDDTLFYGKNLRCLGDNAIDVSSMSIAGFFVLVDIIYALLCVHRSSANNWCNNLNNVNKIIAPSLTRTSDGVSNGTKPYVVSYKDALKIIGRHRNMANCVSDIANAYAECERGITHVVDVVGKCEVVSLLVYNQRQTEFHRLFEKQKALCDLHDASASCVVCKEKISDFGHAKHCFDCYVKQFPTIRFEILVRGAINATFEGFIHNKVMPSVVQGNECGRQIDHRLQIGNTIQYTPHVQAWLSWSERGTVNP